MNARASINAKIVEHFIREGLHPIIVTDSFGPVRLVRVCYFEETSDYVGFQIQHIFGDEQIKLVTVDHTAFDDVADAVTEWIAA